MDSGRSGTSVGPPAIVILPTYNERDNLGGLVEQILRVGPATEVLIVDDASPDGTGDLADAIALRNTRVSVIHRAGKLGLGSAYVEGFRHALSRGAARAVTMDADGSHHPRHLPAVIAAADAHDIGIGSRYAPGGEIAADWGRHRLLLSRGANAFTRRALGFAVRDCTSGFRCYRREVLERVDWDRIRSNGYSFLVEALHAARERGCTFAEAPIRFENRLHGRSKIGFGEVVKAIVTVLRLAGPRAPRRPAGPRH